MQAWDWLSSASSRVWLLVALHLVVTSLVVLLAAGGAFALRRGPARIRHALWLIAAIVLLFPVSSLSGWLPLRRLPHVAGWSRLRGGEGQVSSSTSDAVAIAPGARARPAVYDRGVLPVLSIAWALGCAVAALRALSRHRAVTALARRSRPADPGRETEALARVCRRLGARRPALWLLEDLAEPGVWGLLQPVLLLPAGLASRLVDGELEAVFSHELMHVRRRDAWTALVSTIGCLVFWFYPLAWLIDRRLLLEREQACDEGVLRSGGRREDYVGALWKVLCFGLHRPLGMVSLVGRSNLKRRLEMIRAERGLGRVTLRQRGLVAAVAGMALAVGLVSAAMAREGDASAARVYGVIYDESGAPVPGAQVSVQAADDGTWRADTITGGSGEYVVSGVPSGTYRVEVSRPGFKLIRRRDVRVAGEAAVKVDGVLQLGEVSEGLTIRADAPAKPQGQAKAPRSRAGGDVRPPRLVQSVRPEYPAAAREAKTEGVVCIEARVGVDGAVRALKLVGRACRSRARGGRHAGGPAVGLRAGTAERKAGRGRPHSEAQLHARRALLRRS